MKSSNKANAATRVKLQFLQEKIRAVGGAPTTAWIAVMHSGDVQLQRECLAMLEFGGFRRRELLPTLVAIFQDPTKDAGLRSELGSHIGATRIVGAIYPLCQSLRFDPYPRIRASAVDGLSHFPERQCAVDALIAALTNIDEHDFVRASAAEYLGGAICGDPLPALVKVLTDDSPEQVRLSAVRAIGALKDARALTTLNSIKQHGQTTVEVAQGTVSLESEAKRAIRRIRLSMPAA